MANFLTVHFLALCIFISAAAEQSLAVAPHFEIRLPVGFLLSKPEQLNSAIHSSLSVNHTLSFGADILIEPEIYGLAAGLRFDSISAVPSDGSLGGHKMEVAARIFSLVARKAYRQKTFFWAPVTSLGVFMPSDLNIRAADGTWKRYTANHVSSFSFGMEAGGIWDIFLVSFEGGYQFLKLKNANSADGTRLLDSAGDEIVVELGGLYGKFLLGLRF